MYVAALAIEDAAVLGSLFSRLREWDQIPTLLYAYQELRKPRADELHEEETSRMAFLTLPHGPTQSERDESMREARRVAANKDEWSASELAEQWASILATWAYDAYDESEDWWVHWGLLRERAKSGLGGFNVATFDRLEVRIDGSDTT